MVTAPIVKSESNFPCPNTKWRIVLQVISSSSVFFNNGMHRPIYLCINIGLRWVKIYSSCRCIFKIYVEEDYMLIRTGKYIYINGKISYEINLPNENLDYVHILGIIFCWKKNNYEECDYDLLFISFLRIFIKLIYSTLFMKMVQLKELISYILYVTSPYLYWIMPYHKISQMSFPVYIWMRPVSSVLSYKETHY